MRKHGRVPEGRQTPVTGEYWCVPRQRRRGGHWALGCTVCANLKRSNWIKYDTRWARYEIRTIPQACIMTAHARSDQHIRALNVRLLHRPGSDEAAAQDTPTDCEGSGVFRGSVPPALGLAVRSLSVPVAPVLDCLHTSLERSTASLVAAFKQRDPQENVRNHRKWSGTVSGSGSRKLLMYLRCGGGCWFDSSLLSTTPATTRRHPTALG